MALDMTAAVKLLVERMRREDNQRMPFWGTVSAVSGTQVAVTAPAATTTATATTDAAEGLVIAGDTGIMVPVLGGGSFFIPKETADTAARRVIAPFAWPYATKASTTTTTAGGYTYTHYVFSLGQGTWVYNFMATALMARASNAGTMSMRLYVGSDHRDTSLSSADLTITNPCSLSTSLATTVGFVVPSGGGTVDVGVQIWGSTAIATYAYNATICGNFWRIA